MSKALCLSTVAFPLISMFPVTKNNKNTAAVSYHVDP
jgi:hypothetical protein